MNASADRKIEDGGVVELLASQSDMLLRRIRRQSPDPSTPATVLAVSERTPSNNFKRLTREYELAEHLDRSWALYPIELVHEAGKTALIFEDPGGESLHQFLAFVRYRRQDGNVFVFKSAKRSFDASE